MKKLSTLLFLLVIPAISFCQDTTSTSSTFQFTDQPPEFPGGEDLMMEFIGKNIRYPTEAKVNGISGRVYVSFVVDTSGNVVDVKMLRGINGLNEEAMRVVKSMPKWKPGSFGGKIVSAQYTLPIVFNIATGTRPPGLSSNQNKSFNKGNDFAQAGEYERAIIYYTKAIKEDGSNADPYFNRASCFNELGFSNAACNDWRKAKDLGVKEAEDQITNQCQASDSANLVQINPEFINGGDAGLIKFLVDNLEYPKIAMTNSIQGTVKVIMTVDSTGKLLDAKIIRGIGGGCDEEALYLIRSIKLWKPGYINGVPSTTISVLPVRFKLTK